MIKKTILLCEKIIEKEEHNTIAISGPSPSGKTTIIKALENRYKNDMKTFTTESFVLNFFEFYRKDNERESIKAFANSLGRYKIISIEDADLFRNKPCFQDELVRIINTLNKTTFVITGIDLKEKLPGLFQHPVLNTKLYQINLSKIKVMDAYKRHYKIIITMYQVQIEALFVKLNNKYCKEHVESILDNNVFLTPLFNCEKLIDEICEIYFNYVAILDDEDDLTVKKELENILAELKQYL